MSQSLIQKCFLTELMAELTALAADLPAGGPKTLLDPGSEILGVVIDNLTKAAYFLMIKIQGDEAQALRVDELKLELEQVSTGKPFEHEELQMRARRYAHTIRDQGVEQLFWTGVKGQVASLLVGYSGSIVLGPNWEIAVQPRQLEDGGMDDLPLLIASPSRRSRRGQ